MITTTGGYTFEINLETLQRFDSRWFLPPMEWWPNGNPKTQPFTHPTLGYLIQQSPELWYIARQGEPSYLITNTYMLRVEDEWPEDSEIHHLYYYADTLMFVCYLKSGHKVWFHHRQAPPHWPRIEGKLVYEGKTLDPIPPF